MFLKQNGFPPVYDGGKGFFWAYLHSENLLQREEKGNGGFFQVIEDENAIEAIGSQKKGTSDLWDGGNLNYLGGLGEIELIEGIFSNDSNHITFLPQLIERINIFKFQINKLNSDRKRSKDRSR